MSELSKHLLARKTEKRVPLKDILFLREEYDEIRYGGEEATVYRVSAEFRSEAVAHPQLDDISLAVNDAKRRIVHAVFGEFRKDLSELGYQISSQDTVGARETLDRIRNTMYEL